MRKITLLITGVTLSLFGLSQLSENFESGVPPTGWTQFQENGAVNWIANNGNQNGSVTALSGTKNAYIYEAAYNDSRTKLITPSMDLSSGSYQLKFWHSQVDWSGDQDTLAIFYKTSAGGTWTYLTSYNTNITSWTQEIIQLPAGSNDYYIAFEAYLTYGRGVTIDDVLVELIPSCPQPSGLSANNITENAADLLWTTGGASEWIIEYGVSGFIQGTGTTIQTTSNPHALTGLNNATQYSFYVRDFCAIGDSSSWAGPYSFTTLCPTSGGVTLPYLQVFNTYVPNCWSEAKGDLSEPTVFTSTTSSTWTADGFANVGTTGAARVNLWQTTHAEWLISPSIDATPGVILEFDIAATDYASTGAASFGADDTVAVVISTDNGTTWNRSNSLMNWTATNEPSATGDHITIDLSAYTGIVRIGFYAGTGATTGDNDIFIDNFEVYEICNDPSVLAASNVTNTSADLSWTTGGATEWDIEYGVSGFTPGAGTQVHAATNPFALTGLTGGTVYEFYVRDYCGSTYQSSWVGPFAFTTTSVSLYEINKLDGVSINPNPSIGEFNVSFDASSTKNVAIKVLNLQGMEIYAKSFVNTNNVFNTTVELNNASNGVYFVQVVTDMGTHIEKVVIK
jgi:hypothetical protein